MTGEDPRLDSLRRTLEKTESDLAALGYMVERCVTPEGACLAHQAFDEQALILVLFGRVEIQSNDQSALLGPGDRLEVPAGVPYTMRVVSDTPAYWLHALRKESSEPPGSGQTV